MWSRLLLVPAIASCAQLAGLDETSGEGREPVSLAFERVSIGATVVRAPADLTGHTATYLLEDPADPTNVTRFPAEQIGTDTWSAQLFQPAPVLFDLPEPVVVQRHWDFDQRALTGAIVVFEHPDPQLVSPDSVFDVTINYEPAYNGEAMQLFVAGGVWPVRGLENPVVGTVSFAVPRFAMSTMGSLTGRPFERITTQDAPFVLRYSGAQLIGVGPITPFEQTGMDALTANVAAVATDQMLDLQINPAEAATRFSAARPAVPNLGFGWAVRAAAGHELAQNAGVNLHSANPLMTDTVVQVAYANPFVDRGWRSVLTWQASASRSVTPTGQLLVTTLSAGMFQVLLEPGPATVLDLPAGLPELITLDGRSLSTDNLTIPAPTRPLEVTFVSDRENTTLFELELIEIAPNVDATALVQTRTLAMAGLEPRFFIPPELLVAGKTYTIRASTTVDSFPNLAGGDLRTRSLPRATAFLDSGVFTVMP